jgi:hypothetical protein
MRNVLVFASIISLAQAYTTFVAPGAARSKLHSQSNAITVRESRARSSSSLKMVDDNIILGAGVAFAGLAVGIGLVSFTESVGERSKARGGGLSEDMTTRITGMLMEDVEVSSVNDLGSLTGQLEAALKETGAKENFEVSEDRKKEIEAEADDGW